MSSMKTPSTEYIPVQKITQNPYQHRMIPDETRMWELLEEVEELKDSHSDNLDLTNEQKIAAGIIETASTIEKEGLLQPIRVTPGGEKSYQLVFGETRWWSHRYLDREEIAAHIVEVSDMQKASQGIIENINRTDPNVLEKGDGVYTAFRQQGIELEPSEIANVLTSLRRDREPDWDKHGGRPPGGRDAFITVCNKFGKSLRSIEQWLKAVSVPQEIHEMVLEQTDDPSQKRLARLARIEDERLQVLTCAKIQEQDLDRNGARKLIKWAKYHEDQDEIEAARSDLEEGSHVNISLLDQKIEGLTAYQGPEISNKKPRADGSGTGEEISSTTQDGPDDEDSESESEDNDSTLMYYPKLHCDDAGSFLQSLPDNSMDCVITDPPYGGSFEANWEEGEEYSRHETWDGMSGLDGIPEELERVLSPDSHVFVFCIGQNLVETQSRFEAASGFEFGHLLTWVKHNHNAAGGYWNRIKEQILCFEYGDGTFNGKTHNDVLKYKIDSKPNRVHLNQKPRSLLEELIELSTDKGDTVLDPYGGSYAVARAAMATNRRGVSCELSKDKHREAIDELVDKQKKTLKMQNPDWDVQEVSITK